MKIGIISSVNGYPWAGSEELWQRMALLALEKGDTVRAILHRDLHAGDPTRQFVSNGGTLLEWRRSRIARLATLEQAMRPNFTDRKLGNPDVLLVSAGSLPSLAYLPGLGEFLTGTSIPFVLLVQFNADCLLISPQERARVGAILQRAAAVVFVSRQNHRQAERQYNLDFGKRARVIYNPIRIRLEKPLPMPEEADKMWQLACVARFEVLWKAQDLLVELLSQDPWKNAPLQLNLYGDGPDKPLVEGLVARLGMTGKVRFPGYVRDLPALWAANHLLVLPSRGEGTPLAALEAMMCGRPVLTTDVGGNREIIEDGITGFIADGCTLRSLGGVLQRAWEVRENWLEMGRKAHVAALNLQEKHPERELYSTLLEQTG